MTERSEPTLEQLVEAHAFFAGLRDSHATLNNKEAIELTEAELILFNRHAKVVGDVPALENLGEWLGTGLSFIDTLIRKLIDKMYELIADFNRAYIKSKRKRSAGKKPSHTTTPELTAMLDIGNDLIYSVDYFDELPDVIIPNSPFTLKNPKIYLGKKTINDCYMRFGAQHDNQIYGRLRFKDINIILPGYIRKTDKTARDTFYAYQKMIKTIYKSDTLKQLNKVATAFEAITRTKVWAKWSVGDYVNISRPLTHAAKQGYIKDMKGVNIPKRISTQSDRRVQENEVPVDQYMLDTLYSLRYKEEKPFKKMEKLNDANMKGLQPWIDTVNRIESFISLIGRQKSEHPRPENEIELEFHNWVESLVTDMAANVLPAIDEMFSMVRDQNAFFEIVNYAKLTIHVNRSFVEMDDVFIDNGEMFAPYVTLVGKAFKNYKSVRGIS